MPDDFPRPGIDVQYVSGPRGVPGPAGPAGPEGPEGPAGPAGPDDVLVGHPVAPFDADDDGKAVVYDHDTESFLPGLAGSGSADEVTFTPAGTIAATTVQAAIEEVAAEAGSASGDNGIPAILGTRRQVPATEKLSFPGFVGPNGAASFGGTTIHDRAATSCTYRTAHPVLITGTYARLEYTNSVVTGSTEADGGANITVKASVVDAAGVIHPVTFGGNATKTLAPGERVVSDPITDILLAAGTTIHVMTYVTGSSAGIWPGGIGITGDVVAASTTVGYASGSDTTATGAITNGTGAGNATQQLYAYGPSVISCDPVDAKTQAVAVYGDSIESTAAADVNESFIEQVLHDNSVPTVRGALSGCGFSSTLTRRAALMHGCSVAICALGTNDTRDGSASTAQVQARAITAWNTIRTAGATRVFQTTIWPASTGTAGAQTATGNTARSGFNDWLRDGAPILSGAAVAVGSSAPGTLRAGSTGHPLTDYMEVADLVEPSRNAGIWQVAYFGDGVHPMPAGQTAAKVAIDPLLFGGEKPIPPFATAPSRLRKVGRTYTPRHSAQSTVQLTNGTCTAALIRLDGETRIDRLDAWVRTAGTAGCLIRLAIYGSATDGDPGTLLKDAGTIDGASATLQSVTFTPVTVPAGLAFLTMLLIGAPATRPFVQSGTGSLDDAAGGTGNSVLQYAHTGLNFNHTDATSAAPTTLGAFAGGAGAIPLIGFRISA